QMDETVKGGPSNPERCQKLTCIHVENLSLASSEKSQRIQNTFSIDYMGHARHQTHTCKYLKCHACSCERCSSMVNVVVIVAIRKNEVLKFKVSAF
ncbi:hypothetical protein BDR04DRAFT_1100507, partial [Suillus decipiens]